MGFLDKAKKLAEQAQTKLDEVQKQVNTSGGSSSQDGPITEYDQHGRPIPREQTATPPHGDPLTGAGGAPAGSTGPTPDPNAPAAAHDEGGAPATATHGDPLGSSAGPTPDPSAPAPSGGGLGASEGPPPSPGVTPTESSSGPPAPIEGASAPPPSPGVPATPSSPPVASADKAPAMPGAPGTDDEDANRPSHTPPKLTGGDPLAG